MAVTYEWDASGGRLTQMAQMIQDRVAQGWELHSWNLFALIEVGGDISPYRNEEFYAVWMRKK